MTEEWEVEAPSKTEVVPAEGLEEVVVDLVEAKAELEVARLLK